MKNTGRYWKIGAAAAVMALLFAGTSFAGQEGPGMAEGNPITAERKGVIRRDSGAEAAKETEPAETMETVKAAEIAEPAEAKSQEQSQPDTVLPGVSVDSLEGLTYDIRKLHAAEAEDVEQMIVIAGHDGTYARVTLYQKNQTGTNPDTWEWTALVDTEGRMGRNGMGKQVEGDEKTPVGLYTAGMVFGNKENPGTSLPYTHVTPTHYWVGDSNSPHYNQFVDTAVMTEPFDKGKSENLSAYGDVYNYCLDMGYNLSGTPHLGSALFLHCTNGYGTAGCVGIPEEDMAQILRFLKPGAKILLDLSENISKY